MLTEKKRVKTDTDDRRCSSTSPHHAPCLVQPDGIENEAICYKVRVAVDDDMGNGCSLREERCPLAFPGFNVMRTNWGRQIDRKLNQVVK